MVKRAGLLVLSATLLSSATSTAVTLNLTVTPTTSVVGIPPSLLIEIRNQSTGEVSISNWFVLHVTPLDGSRDFFAKVASRHEASANTDLSPLTEHLAPGDAVVVGMPSGVGLREPTWFLDPRLSTAGVYRLAVALAEEVKAAGVTDAQLEDAGTSSSPVQKLIAAHVLSNEVTVTLTEPTGVDREACDWLAAQLAKSGCPIGAIGRRLDIAEALVNRFPTSTYAPYFAAAHRVGSDSEKVIANLQSAITTVRDHPVGDWYRWSLASAYEERARTNQELRPDLTAADHRAAIELLEYLKANGHLQLFRDASGRRANALRDAQ